jgi:site-specific recombinase XerD
MTPLRKRMTEELQLRNLSPVTAGTYLGAVERFAKYFNKSPQKLGAEHVREYLMPLIRDNHAMPSTVLVNRAALRFVYVCTLKQNWFEDEIPQPKRRLTLPGILSTEEVTRMLDGTHNLKHWSILATFYATALRCGELQRLRVDDIDGKRMVLHVREGKGRIPRDIALSPVLLERLSVYFRQYQPKDWLFPSRQNHGSMMEDRSLRYVCRQAAKRAGIKRRVHPHLFRHSHARCRRRPPHHSGTARTCRHQHHGALSTRIDPASASRAQSLRCTPAQAHRSDRRSRTALMTQHRLEVADVFRQHAQEFFTRWGHTLSAPQRKVFRDICACRTAALGARFQQCNHCSHQNIQFHSCRNRHCPKCQTTARDQWLDRTAKELLPVPYSHVIFTLPGALSPLLRQNAELIYNLLFRCVSETLLTIARDPSRLGADLGFLAVLHTRNQKMLTHPHLHCLVPAGGLSPDRSRWVHSRKRFFLPGAVLGRLLRGKFLALLAAAFRRNKLRMVGPLQSLQRPEAFDRFVRSLRKPKWVVEVRAPFGGPEHVLKYLARYTHRVAISNGRLLELRDGQVVFRWRDSANHNTQKVMTMDAIEFIRRFLLHVLPPGFVKIRHFGFLANGCRAKALKLSRTLLHASAQPDPLSIRQRHAIERKCPCCGIGTLCFLGYVPGHLLNPSMTPVCATIDSS